MPTGGSRRNRRAYTWREYRRLQILLFCSLLIGPAFIWWGIYSNQRDRPSLQWPTVAGTIMQSDSWYQGGKHSHYGVDVTYTYRVNGRHYMGHKVSLWNPHLHGSHDMVKAFVVTHPVHSSVDVHYDPQDPENSVLIPGADEVGNRASTWAGGLILGAITLGVILSWRFFARTIAEKKAAEAGRPRHEQPAFVGLPHAYASYEPASKRKLNCFPDRSCLLQVLGHDGKKIQEWKPEDRVIDASGQEYRLVSRPDNQCYDIEPTGQTWSCEKLLDVALADARLTGKDPNALHRAVTDVPVEKRMAVLMKCIDDLPVAPRRALIGFALFLLAFFLAVAFVAYKIVTWLQSKTG